MPGTEDKRSTEINVRGSDGQLYLRFAPRSEAIKQVETGQAVWPERTLSFAEQISTPMSEVVVPHPMRNALGNDARAVKFVPKHVADSMVRMGQAKWPDRK